MLTNPSAPTSLAAGRIQHAGLRAKLMTAEQAAAPEGERESAGRRECQWQREQLPEAIRDLVLDDQRLRNDICWLVFDC